MRFQVLAILCALVVAGCASAADRALQKSEPYRAGYDDGCAAATGSGTATYKDTAVRNDAAYKAIAPYRAGWNSGYANCRRTGTGLGTGGDSMLRPPGPGH